MTTATATDNYDCPAELGVVSRPTVLIADDDKSLVEVLAARFRDLGFQPHTCYNGADALKLALKLNPTLVCLDIGMPSGSGLGVAEVMLAHSDLSDTPIVMLTGKKDEETIRRCECLSAFYVPKTSQLWMDIKAIVDNHIQIPRPVDDVCEWPSQADEPEVAVASSITPHRHDPGGLPTPPTRRVLDRVFEMFGQHTEFFDRTDVTADRSTEEPPWVLVIDDDQDFSFVLKLRLETHGVVVARAFDGSDGVTTACSYPADAIVLDFEMPGVQGDHILRKLKQHPVTKNIPVIMVTGRKDVALQQRVLNLGASAFLTKPLDMDVLFTELSKYMSVL